MISHRRNIYSTILCCTLLAAATNSHGQTSTDAAAALPNLDAAAASSHSAALPPPAPLPQDTVQNLSPQMTPALAVAPAEPQTAIPGVMPGLQAPAVAPAPAPSAPVAGEAAPAVTLPATPGPVAGALAPQQNFETAAPAEPAVPPAVSTPMIVEPANQVAPTNAPPLISGTASGNPALPVLLNSDIAAIEQKPLPALTPASPLIPGPSLAETANQRRQLTTLPGSGGNTNYANATIGGFTGPAKPLITPPSIVDPVQGSDIGKNYPPLQAVMPQAHATPFHLDDPSAFGTPSPTYTLTYYQSKTLRRSPDMVQLNPNPRHAEIIVLKSGQEHLGLVQERGDNWQVELLNGTIVQIPASKVAAVRKALPVATSTPSARNMAFPPREYYRENF